MGALVLAQVVLAAEALLAPATRVGADAAVDAPVAGQLLVSREGLLAVFVVADEGSLA